MYLSIGKKPIGEDHPVFVIAEIASAHQGDVELCKNIIRSASKTGADAIKFQKFTCEEFIVPTDPRYKNFKKIELSEEEWHEVISYAKKFNWEILADVFDERSANLMDELGITAFKIHSTDLTNPYLISHVAKKGKPVLLGVGGATLKEISDAINLAKLSGNDKIVLIHGFQAFPTKVEDINLRRIQTLRNTFKLNVGYHDHIDAESQLALILPSIAVAFGARVIEKHITLDRGLKGFDYYSALTQKEFKKMVEYIREVEASFGSEEIKFSVAEKKYRETMKKNIVARTDIPAGDTISIEMLAFKRSEPGLPPSEADKIIGRKTKVSIKKDEVITWDKLL